MNIRLQERARDADEFAVAQCVEEEERSYERLRVNTRSPFALRRAM